MTPGYCTEAGAKALARRIQEYWAERGYLPPAVWALPGITSKSNGTSVCGLRSDMLGGLPRRRAA